MDKSRLDQAEGLRRMLAGARPRVFTFLSSTPGESNGTMLASLAESLAQTGNAVLMLDARMGARGVASSLGIHQPVTLLHVARREYMVEDAIYDAPEGFSLATLARGSMGAVLRNHIQFSRLAASFDALSQQFDVMMVDAALDAEDDFPLAAMADGEIVVQVSDSADSIKAAYAIIKRVHARHGQRPFGILVTGTSEARAQVVYANMANVASRYLAISLHSIGFVLAEDISAPAAREGQYPSYARHATGSSVAFRRLAGYFSCSAVPVA